MTYDIGVIIAVVGSTVTIVGVVMAMMFWARSEGNELRKEIKEDRRDFLQLIRCIENSINEIKSENKDFHWKLLEIERNKSKP